MVSARKIDAPVVSDAETILSGPRMRDQFREHVESILGHIVSDSSRPRQGADALIAARECLTPLIQSACSRIEALAEATPLISTTITADEFDVSGLAGIEKNSDFKNLVVAVDALAYVTALPSRIGEMKAEQAAIREQIDHIDRDLDRLKALKNRITGTHDSEPWTQAELAEYRDLLNREPAMWVKLDQLYISIHRFDKLPALERLSLTDYCPKPSAKARPKEPPADPPKDEPNPFPQIAAFVAACNLNGVSVSSVSEELAADLQRCTVTLRTREATARALGNDSQWSHFGNRSGSGKSSFNLMRLIREHPMISALLGLGGAGLTAFILKSGEAHTEQLHSSAPAYSLSAAEFLLHRQLQQELDALEVVQIIEPDGSFSGGFRRPELIGQLLFSHPAVQHLEIAVKVTYPSGPPEYFPVINFPRNGELPAAAPYRGDCGPPRRCDLTKRLALKDLTASSGTTFLESSAHIVLASR